jgi:hypothetical protein
MLAILERLLRVNMNGPFRADAQIAMRDPGRRSPGSLCPGLSERTLQARRIWHDPIVLTIFAKASASGVSPMALALARDQA